MRRKIDKKGTGKVITGMLIGGVVGATVGWLTAPASGSEMRRRIKGEMKDVRDKAKAAVGNVENRARELAGEVDANVDEIKGSVSRRRRATTTTRS